VYVNDRVTVKVTNSLSPEATTLKVEAGPSEAEEGAATALGRIRLANNARRPSRACVEL
jgi:hypothetical protein